MRSLLLCAALLRAVPAGAWFWEGGTDILPKAKALYSAGKYGEVVAQLSPETVQKMPRGAHAQAYFYLGLSYERLGKLTEALSTYQLASKLYPKDINLLSELGGLLHAAGLNEQAQPIFEKVLSIHPNNARAHLGLAEIDRSLGVLDESADHYEAALESMADQPGLWRDYAEVLLSEREFTTAGLAARKALALSEDADSKIVLAFVERAQGRLEEGIGLLQDAAALAPQRREIGLTSALWMLEDGRYDDAKRISTERLKADPYDPLALWIRARVSLRDDRTADAVRDLREASTAARRSPFVAAAAKALLASLEVKF